MQWLIENMPESDYAAGLLLYSEDDKFETERMKTAWQHQIKKSPQNSIIAGNAASWHADCDRKSALQIATQILEFEPENIFAIGLIHCLSCEPRDLKQLLGFRDLAFEASCDKRIRSFRPVANESLAHICDEIQLYLYILLDCLHVPHQTVWSNEQVLQLNPNDVILRCEVLGWCERNELRRRIYAMHDPELARKRTEHILWLLENVPHADLYFLTRYHEAQGLPSHEKILKKAITAQRNLHGKTVAKYRPEFPKKPKGKGP